VLPALALILAVSVYTYTYQTKTQVIDLLERMRKIRYEDQDVGADIEEEFFYLRNHCYGAPFVEHRDNYSGIGKLNAWEK